jgi:hypothetical protein
MGKKPRLRIGAAVAVAAVIVSGCTAVPADYAAALSRKDPKWRSPQCVEARSAASNYKERNVNWASGLLIGPYGLAIVAAGKEHQEKQRVLLAREVQMRCSNLPLPKNLEVASSPAQNRKSR